MTFLKTDKPVSSQGSNTTAPITLQVGLLEDDGINDGELDGEIVTTDDGEPLGSLEREGRELACLDGEVLVEGSCVRPMLGLDDGLNDGELDGEIVITDGELLGFDVGSLENEG